MDKHNTEGYVLAYLLIVITVMGVIAATLMTSTLQVVQAQEKSLVYMKDKYEAMGEVEKEIAEISVFSISSSGFDYSGRKSPNDSIPDPSYYAFDSAEEKFLSYMSAYGYTLSGLSTLESESEDGSITTYQVVYPFSKALNHRGIVVQYELRILCSIKTDCNSEQVTKTDPETHEPILDANGNAITETVNTYSFNFNVPTKISFSHYTISSEGDDPT